jgi:hypothetical protein
VDEISGSKLHSAAGEIGQWTWSAKAPLRRECGMQAREAVVRPFTPTNR